VLERLLCLLSYATIAHTPGLRIRFVRFRQTVWVVEVIVTSPGSISGSRPSRQIRSGSANRELRICEVLTSPLSYARIPGV
jgi:hypothetical protein